MITSEKSRLALELWQALSKSCDTVRKNVARQVFVHDLTAPQFHVLEVLKESGQIPLRKISEHLMVTGANITCVVDNLEKEDLVRRIPSKKDRRVILAELTEKGRDKFEQVYPEYLQKISESFANLSLIEQKRLTALLNNLL